MLSNKPQSLHCRSLHYGYDAKKNYNKYYIMKRNLQKPFYQNSCKKKKFSKKKILSEMLRLRLAKNSSKYGSGDTPQPRIPFSLLI